MSDKELEEYIKKVEPNFNSHIEKGTIEMSNEYYNLLEERIRRLMDENNQLKEQNKELIEILKTIRHDVNFCELCDGYIVLDKLNELEGKNE